MQQPYNQSKWQPHYQKPSWNNHPTQLSPGQFQQAPFPTFPPQNPTGLWAWYKTRSRKAKIGLGCVMVIWFLLFFTCIGTAIGSSHLATLATPTAIPTATFAQAAEFVSPVATMSPTPVPTQQPTPTPTFILVVAPTH